MFTVRETFGLAAGALVVWTGFYSVYFTGRRYPPWVVPGQGDDGRQVAGLNLTAIVAALTVCAGAGAGWLASSVAGWSLVSRRVVATSIVVGLLALPVLAWRARRIWPEHASRIDAASERRLANRV